MSATTSSPPATAMPSVVVAVLPLIAVVLVIFLITGLAIPALPLHVHERLGLGTFVVGLVSGAQFAASLVSRIWSGRYADRRGAKCAVVAGLIAAAVSGLLYILSLAVLGAPAFSVTILLIGRALLGGAESFASVFVEAAGLMLIWLAAAPGLACAGAVLTGAGYALVYPGLGIEAVRRVPAQSRGLAMGTYTAFFDLGIAVASPALGLLAARTGLNTVFLVSALVVLGAGAVAVQLLRVPARAL
ncbi:MAG: MFS transporter [Alphaproteobacteria bacterium]|nr:MFS transporter [Alphaproteobacteria bacterium]MBV9151912.1 MFS transporter [Alphaproteobacteria bacterium]MBV9587650.1 MFS transporter [Alphaproteobacteria bacterium]